MILETFKRFSLPENHKFYVYFLIDPRNNNVFYIGKGKGKRINDHEYQALRGVCSKKCNKIKSIIESGNKIIKYKIAGFDNEQDAYDYESICINNFGLDNLTNMVAGGAGSFERRYKDSIKRYRAKIRQEQFIPTWKLLSSKANIFIHWALLTDFGKYVVKSEGYEINIEKMPRFAKFIENSYLKLYNEIIPNLFKEIISSKNDTELFFNELKSKGVKINYGCA